MRYPERLRRINVSPVSRAAILVGGALILVPLLYVGRGGLTQTSSPNNPDLQLQVEVPSQIVVGEPVDLRLVISNSSGSVMNLSGGDPAEAYALVVYDDAGHVVWLSLHDQILSSVLAKWTIAPHDQVSHQVSWSGVGNDGQPLPPGKYTVVGKIFLSDEDTPESLPTAVTLVAQP